MSYRFYSTCIPVKGYLRTIVYDLQNDDYHFVPREIEHLLRAKDPDDPFTSSLNRNRLVFVEDKQSGKREFSGLDTRTYDHPSAITNAIIEISTDSRFDRILGILDEVDCYNIQLIYQDTGDAAMNYLIDCLQAIHESPVKHCELVIPFTTYDEITKKGGIKYPELKVFFVYEAPYQKYHRETDPVKRLVFFEPGGFSYSGREHRKKASLFYINTSLFTESIQYNNYYNRKLYIDKAGDVHNGPIASPVFGNIYHASLDIKEIIASQAFRALWHVKKDIISVCRECEFKYMCIDSRIPVRHSGTENWYHSTECNYNPYIAKWRGEEGYLPLEEAGIEVKEDRLSIDLDRLNMTIANLYS